jgi:hypothetical protein
MVGTEVSETLVFSSTWTWLIARENFGEKEGYLGLKEVMQ